MHNDDLYTYWLYVDGTTEERATVFEKLKENDIIGRHLEPNGVELSPLTYHYPEKHGSGPEWNETEMENILHGIALKVPGAVLEIHGKNTDDRSYGFTKKFHGDMYQERKMVTYQPELVDGADVPFEDRHSLQMKHADVLLMKNSIELYELMMKRLTSKDSDTYYVARNMAFLTDTVEVDYGLTTQDIYQLSLRLHDLSGTACVQPLLNGERLDALRELLENGMSTERRAGLGDLSPQQTLAFLLSCSDKAFVYAVEETAYANIEHSSMNVEIDDDGEIALKKELAEFKEASKKPTLEDRISSAAARAEKQVGTAWKEQDFEK